MEDEEGMDFFLVQTPSNKIRTRHVESCALGAVDNIAEVSKNVDFPWQNIALVYHNKSTHILLILHTITSLLGIPLTISGLALSKKNCLFLFFVNRFFFPTG